MTFVRFDFPSAPRRVSRFIIRTVDHNLEKIRFLRVILHGLQGIRDEIDVDFGTSQLNCAVQVVLDPWKNPLAYSAHALEIKDIIW